jgi:hypothetical protein
MEQNNQVSLRDVLNYEAEQYLSEDEIDWIRQTFKGNTKAINIIRKCFIPVMHDLPVEELMNDVWFKGGFDPALIPENELKSIIIGRQETLKFVMGGLVNLKALAHSEQLETETEKALRKKKDSTR